MQIFSKQYICVHKQKKIFLQFFTKKVKLPEKKENCLHFKA